MIDVFSTQESKVPVRNTLTAWPSVIKGCFRSDFTVKALAGALTRGQLPGDRCMGKLWGLRFCGTRTDFVVWGRKYRLL